MAKAGGKKKRKLKESQELPKWLKVLIGSFVAFIPFFFLVILPLIARDHYVKTLKLPKEVFLSSPQLINLVSTSTSPATYKVVINGTEFKIPENFTPSLIGIDSVEFTPESRREARRIFALAQKEPKKLTFTTTGIARWFMPTSLQQYLQLVLRATWHPVSLMFKAQFYASEGITSPIFEARWDAHHRGFIFPTENQSGYIGRVFRTNDPGYFEFGVVDPVNAVTLRDWVNHAMRIKPPSDQIIDPFSPSTTSIARLSELAENPDKEAQVLGQALTEFFRTKQSGWLIPIAIVMEAREYYSELIDLHKQYLSAFSPESKYRQSWNKIFDRSTSKMVKLQIDPQLNLRELRVYCQNLTEFEISQVWLKITVKHALGEEKSFIAALLPHGRLYGKQGKELRIRTPDHIDLADAEQLDYRINQIEFNR